MATGTGEVQEVKSEASNLDFIDRLEPDETEEEGKGAESGKEGAEEAGKGKEGEEGKEVTDEEKAALEAKAAEDARKVTKGEKEDEIRSLRQIARDQKRELDKVTQALEHTNKVLKDANLLSPDDLEKQKELDEFAVKRSEQLEDLLEVMRVNPKFEDVDDVVSQEHFDDLIEAMGRALVAHEGGELKTAMGRIEAEIWAMKNPYKFMYENVKRYHPDYKAAPAAKAGDGEGAASKEEGKSGGEGKEKGKLDIEKVASSIQDLGGGSSGTGGWTAAKIDDMDESELDKVPKDIYDKYLRNELK